MSDGYLFEEKEPKLHFNYHQNRREKGLSVNVTALSLLSFHQEPRDESLSSLSRAQGVGVCDSVCVCDSGALARVHRYEIREAWEKRRRLGGDWS